MCLLAIANNWADTDVNGSITTDTTWTKADSPYTVTKTVEVAEDATLTVESDVKIVFNENTGLIVWGQLIAIGTQEEMIEFTSSKETLSPADWDGIIFKDSSVDATIDSNYHYQSGSILKYCAIEYAGPAVKCEFSAPFIANCTITNNSTDGSGSGIYLSGDAVIRNNTITNNRATGILGDGGGIYSIASYASIVSNFIEGNYAFSNGGGIFVSGSSVLKNNIIMDNSVNGCGGGIYIYYGSPTIDNNGITSNSTDGSGGGIYNEYGKSTMQGNIISTNSAELYGGGICNFGSNAVIESNSVVNNSTADNWGGGIYYENESIIYNAPLAVNNNNIYSNEGYNIYNNTILEITAENNYWGITDTSIVDENIFDMNDDMILGPISYESIATQPHTIIDLLTFPSSQDFGSVNVGNTTTQTITIFNLGTGDRVIGGLSITGTDTSEFAIQNDNCSGHTINPAGNCTVDTVFSPALAGARNATLGIPSNPDSITLEVALSGIGAFEVCPAEKIYGNDSEEAELLRDFRDARLCETLEGQEIIRLYYEWSPMIVKAMEEDGEFREEVKEMIDGIIPLIRGEAE